MADDEIWPEMYHVVRVHPNALNEIILGTCKETLTTEEKARNPAPVKKEPVQKSLEDGIQAFYAHQGSMYPVDISRQIVTLGGEYLKFNTMFTSDKLLRAHSKLYPQLKSHVYKLNTHVKNFKPSFIKQRIEFPELKINEKKTGHVTTDGLKITVQAHPQTTTLTLTLFPHPYQWDYIFYQIQRIEKHNYISKLPEVIGAGIYLPDKNLPKLLKPFQTSKFTL